MVFLKSLVWICKDCPSTEYFSLSELNEEYTLRGTVIVNEPAPTLINYEITCDKHWSTKRMHITQEQNGKTNSLTLKTGDQHLWFKDESSLSSMTGLLDVDLEFSPATNTLPIQRLSLKVSESKTVDAVWVRLEGLGLTRIQQKYSRLTNDCYLYENQFGFKATLQVDALGLVIRYGDLWQRKT
jgi:uncharacterized protein